jgi:hypothetical protein
VHTHSSMSGRATVALATIGLVLAGCSGGGETSDPTREPAESSATAPSAEPGGAGASPAASAPATSGGSAGGGDTGPAAAPGEGRLEVNGETYALTIGECKFQTDGPTSGTVEVRGTEASGAAFAMTQFYLGDKWSQTSVQLDFGPKKIYVIRSAAREGAVPAVVDGTNVTWIETYREFDVAANAQVDLGQGVLNLTCA